MAEPSTYFIRLIPPRPTFLTDLDEAERALMGEHVAYWTEQLRAGTAIAFGPTSEGWGLGLVEVEDAAKLAALEAADPVIRAGVGFRYEIVPLLRAITRPRPN